MFTLDMMVDDNNMIVDDNDIVMQSPKEDFPSLYIICTYVVSQC